MTHITTALDKKEQGVCIFLDFAKAFDSVSHDLILHKLKFNFNIDRLMLKFIKSYLEGRQQQVVISGQKLNPFSFNLIVLKNLLSNIL